MKVGNDKRFKVMFLTKEAYELLKKASKEQDEPMAKIGNRAIVNALKGEK